MNLGFAKLSLLEKRVERLVYEKIQLMRENRRLKYLARQKSASDVGFAYDDGYIEGLIDGKLSMRLNVD